MMAQKIVINTTNMGVYKSLPPKLKKKKVFVSNKHVNQINALKFAVKAFHQANSIENGVGISVTTVNHFSNKKIHVAIHSKNGTGILEINFDPKRTQDEVESLFTRIANSTINEYRTGQKTIQDSEWRREEDRVVFEACQDAVYTDLVYGAASMTTNIDDRALLGKDFAIYCWTINSNRPYLKENVVYWQNKLGYTPIIEMSANKCSGVEYDFVTLDRNIKSISDNGYFLTKTTNLKDKLDVLRSRFTTGKITMIIDKARYSLFLADNPAFIDKIKAYNVDILIDEKTNHP
jgi:hypothetical protein